jgi:AraC-like DNA-binding protein
MPSVPQAYCRSKLIIEGAALGTLLSAVESSFLLARVFDGEGACLVPHKEGAALIERRLETVARLHAGGKTEDKPMLYAALLSLFDLCARSGRAPAVPQDGVAARALAYIGTHLCEPLTLDGIAAALYVSKCYLCRAFSRAVGMTVMDYIGSRRLALAKQLLVTTGKSISEIAVEAGFSGFSYFSNYFRRAEGKTPSAYRRENQ